MEESISSDRSTSNKECNRFDELIDLRVSELIESLVLKRKSLQLTQKDISLKTGIPQPSISRIESLSVVPTLQVLIKILDVMGVKIKIM